MSDQQTEESMIENGWETVTVKEPWSLAINGRKIVRAVPLCKECGRRMIKGICDDGTLAQCCPKYCGCTVLHEEDEDGTVMTETVILPVVVHSADIEIKFEA